MRSKSRLSDFLESILRKLSTAFSLEVPSIDSFSFPITLLLPSESLGTTLVIS